MRAWAHIRDALSEGGRCVLVTVLDVRGSAPREAGARMVVRPGGGFHGTIGGGRLEWQALARAQSLFVADAAEPFSTRSFALGPELGQCCGGRVILGFEIFTAERLAEAEAFADLEAKGGFVTTAEIVPGEVPRRAVVAADGVQTGLAGQLLRERFGADETELLLFGAGHVGRALVLALAPLSFGIRWIDPRADAFPRHVPRNVTCQCLDRPAETLATAPDGAFVLVMTHSHALDQDITQAALAADRFAYVGLIGSETKRARFVSRMRTAGVTETAMSELVCPIGIDGIRSKEPAALAASVAAQLLMRREAICAGIVDPPVLAKRVGEAP